jgi:hypothetical protein
MTKAVPPATPNATARGSIVEVKSLIFLARIFIS